LNDQEKSAIVVIMQGDVAEADDPLRAARLRRLKAGAERRLAWISAKTARRTSSSAPMIAPVAARGLRDIKQWEDCGPQ
jgi:hypothetical protein